MRKSKENHDGSKERHVPGRISQKFGNPFPTAWDISLSIVGADIVFAPSGARSISCRSTVNHDEIGTHETPASRRKLQEVSLDE
jgi:hypothetical protein